MYFTDLTEDLKQEIIYKYTIHKIKKVDLRKEYGYSQKICQKIFKNISKNRLFEYDSFSNKNIIWDKLFNKEYERDLHYWMGFCMADGSVETTKYNTSTLSLTLANEDIDRIKEYSYFWTNNHNIHLITTNGYKTEIFNYKI
jgi:DNA-binding transcriptional regulator WhiA